MGMPDSQQRQQEPYQYQFPIQRVPERDGKKELLDWAVTTFGAAPILTMLAIGAYVLARKAIKSVGLDRLSRGLKR